MVKTIRVFPVKTNLTPDDGMAFIGDPPFPQFLPDAARVHVSVTFTWDRLEGERLARSWRDITSLPVEIGGPAYGDPGGEFTPGMYIKNGAVITTRGCPRNCEYCYVPKREGKLRTLQVKDGYNILDNNLLAAPMDHIKQVFAMLDRQKRGAEFTGGIDPRLVTNNIAEMLKEIRVNRVFLAYDRPEVWEWLRDAADRLSYLGLNKLACYVLVGFNKGDTVERAARRCERVLALGVMPFAMYYRGDNTAPPNKEWKKFIREWIRPAITKAILKEEPNDG